jgi:uncharacterized protein YkwD
MRAHRLAAPVLAGALFILAALIALGGLLDLFAKPDQRQTVYSQPPGDPGAGLESFAAFGLLGWPTPAPTATPLPAPLPSEPPVANDGAAAAEVSSQPTEAPPPAPALEDHPPASDSTAPTPVSNPPATSEYQDYDMANAVLASVNSSRAAQGLAAYSANGALTAAAQSYAQLLAQLDTLTHDAGGGLLARIQASDYPGGFLGEALWEGWGQYAPDAVVNDWLNSPPHREILLSSTYVDIGVGCYVVITNGASNTRCVLDAGAP